MGMFNDLFELLGDVPPMLATAWAVWLGAGALLVLWFRRVQYDAAFPAPQPRPVPPPHHAGERVAGAPGSKPKPASRPSSSPDLVTADTHAADAAERHKPPVVVGDPFGDLATLLDQPAATATPPPAPPAPRAPADSPILSSSGSPIRRANNNDPNPVA